MQHNAETHDDRAEGWDEQTYFRNKQGSRWRVSGSSSSSANMCMPGDLDTYTSCVGIQDNGIFRSSLCWVLIDVNYLLLRLFIFFLLRQRFRNYGHVAYKNYNK